MIKLTKWLCAQWRFKSAWVSVQSDQSSLHAQWVAKDPSFLHADSKYSDQGGYPGLSESLLGSTAIVGFVVRGLIYLVLVCLYPENVDYN